MVQTSFALKVLQISSNKEIIFVSIYVRSTKKFQPHTQTTRNFRYRRIVLGWVVDGKKNHTGTWITTTRNKNDSSIMIPLSDSEFLGTHFPILKQKSQVGIESSSINQDNAARLGPVWIRFTAMCVGAPRWAWESWFSSRFSILQTQYEAVAGRSV
jgi:hypothetical protein